jgi:hypothetical protein
MYNSDSAILKHICQLMQRITSKYSLSDTERYKIIEAKTIILKLARQIDKDKNEHPSSG